MWDWLDSRMRDERVQWTICTLVGGVENLVDFFTWTEARELDFQTAT